MNFWRRVRWTEDLTFDLPDGGMLSQDGVS